MGGTRPEEGGLNGWLAVEWLLVRSSRKIYRKQ